MGRTFEEKHSDDANRTNNWSLLWKAEAIYESMDEQFQQKIIQIYRAERFTIAAFNKTVRESCETSLETRRVILNRWSKMPEGTTRQYFKEFYNDRAACKAFQDEMNSMSARNLQTIEDRLAADAMAAPNQKDDAARDRGAIEIDPFIDMLEFWILRREASKVADRMFAQLGRWTGCDGKLKIPERRPPLEGFNNLSSRVVEWLIWPFLSPGVFGTQRQVLLYGRRRARPSSPNSSPTTWPKVCCGLKLNISRPRHERMPVPGAAEVQRAAGLERSLDVVQERFPHDAALPVPLFPPRIGEVHVYGGQRRIGQEFGKDAQRIAVNHYRIGQLLLGQRRRSENSVAMGDAQFQENRPPAHWLPHYARRAPCQSQFPPPAALYDAQNWHAVRPRDGATAPLSSDGQTDRIQDRFFAACGGP